MRLNEIYDSYKDQIDFLLIYIREAHPSDGWQTPQNLYDEVVYETPHTDDERADIAAACQIDLDLEMPMLIDSIDNDVEDKYFSKPIRLFVIDANGTITFNGAPGPHKFDPDAWEAAIKEQIAAVA